MAERAASEPAKGEAMMHEASSLSDLTANPLILLKWYYFLEAKLLSLFKGFLESNTKCND